MRSVRSECLSAVSILTIPLGIFFAFPTEAFHFTAKGDAPCPVRMAFVTMTPQAEQLSLRAVRSATAWRGKAGSSRRLHTELLCQELPEDKFVSVLSLRDRSPLPTLPLIHMEQTPFLPSQKAPPPTRLPADPAADPLVFSREELLKLN